MKLHDFNIKFSRVLIVVLIAVLISTTLVYALDTQPFTINSGVYPGASSFTFWRQEDDYYCKNNFGVIVEPHGSDAQAVLEAAITLLPDGGSISCQGNDTYEFEAAVTIPKGIIIEGNNARWEFTDIGDYAVILSDYDMFLGAQLNNLQIVGDANSNGVQIITEANTKVMTNVIIEGFSGADMVGLTLNGVEGCVFEEVFIIGNYDGVNMTDGNGYGGNANSFIRCVIQANTNFGVQIASTHTDWPNDEGWGNNNNVFDGCIIQGNGGWGFMPSASANTIFKNGWFEANGDDVSSGDCIATLWGDSGPIRLSLIDNVWGGAVINYHDVNTLWTKFNGNHCTGNVTFEGDSTYSIIEDNYFQGNAPNITSGRPSSPLSIERNVGFKTRSSGPVNIESGHTDVTFAHTLAGEPTTVEVTIAGEDPGSVYVASDSTNTTVYVENASAGGMVALVTVVYLTPL